MRTCTGIESRDVRLLRLAVERDLVVRGGGSDFNSDWSNDSAVGV